MTGEIKMLNAKDGDAILVYLEKEDENMVMVVDGGRKGDYLKTVRPELLKLLEKAKKKAPDIVVCTHYDADHIAGLIPLVAEFINDIQEVWVKIPPEVIPGQILNEENFVHHNLRKNLLLHDISIDKPNLDINILEQSWQYINESERQLRDLLFLVPTNKRREAWPGHQISGWPEIKILGPTQTYYDELFPANAQLENLILERALEVNDLHQNLILEEALDNPCAALRNEETAQLSSVNKASIIFAIDGSTGRHLFTGDAGIDSFKNIPNWQKELRDLHWLKVPHHGSLNNISQDLIEIMSPSHAYNSGDKPQREEVLNCIATNPRNYSVRSTKECGTLIFEII